MTEERAFTVSEAMTAARQALEGVSLRVIGEVSEFNDKPGYKAAYFSVCDGDAVMPCMMWRDQYNSSGVRLECGALVEMSGRFSAYVPKGRMQFQVQSPRSGGRRRAADAGCGSLAQARGRGLMRPERKRAIPEYPTRIAVVTSPRGKAIHDVIRTLGTTLSARRASCRGCRGRGRGAAARSSRDSRRRPGAAPDVILLVRGGGSYEDLMPFNAEEVARAVAASPVPVVTGIGHEPDTSIADMVSDMRASTPTAAAEAVAPSVDELCQRIEQASRRLAGGSCIESRRRSIGSRSLRRDRSSGIRWLSWARLSSDSILLAGASFGFACAPGARQGHA